MSTKGTILIVDDTPADLELLVDTLTAQGYHVHPAGSGERALASVAAQPPELILLDIQMPGMDGFEVCRRLKAQTESRDIPIMFISVSGERAERLAGLNLGAVDYITKPFECEELLARVRTHLELGRLRVRLERQAANLRQANEQLRSELAERKQAEEALRRSETKFRTLYDSTSDAVMLLDPKGFFDCNQATLTMFGCATRDEFCSKHPADVSPPVQPDGTDSRTLANQRIATAMEKGSHQFEWLHKRADTGETFPAEVLLNALELDGKRVLQTVVRDTTERERATEALRQSEEQFRAMFELASVGIAQADPHTGQWLRVNKKMCEITGYAAGELLQMRVPDITYQEDRQLDREAFERVVRGEAPDYRMEKRYIRKDGALAWVNVNMTIIRDATGQPLRTMAAIEDITERKRAEEASRASQQIIEGILNVMPVRVFWKDKNLVYSGCNAVFARDAGFTDPKDMIGKDDYQMGWREQAELYRSDDRQVIESGCSKMLIEESQTTPEGSNITLLSSKIPLRGSNGEVSGVLGMYMDITERKQAEEVLRQRVKLQDQLARTAAAVPGMIYSLLMRPDGSTRMPYASGALSEVFGLQPKDVIEDAAPVFSLIHPDDLGHVMATIAESARTLNPWRDDFRVGHTRLGEIWVEGHSVPQREPDGSILWHGFIQNITERKRTEEELRRTSELLLRTGEMAKVGGWELDLRTMKVFWALQTCRIHEVDPPVAPALDQAISFYAPEARPIIQAAVQAGIDSGTPFDLDLPLTTAKGRSIWVRAQGSAMMEGGKAVKLRGSFQDITERKRAELRHAAFANLGQRLNAANTAQEATRIIAEMADDLLGWDACMFSLLSPSSDLLDHVLNVDTIDGRRVESSPGSGPPSALARRTIEAGGQLILKEEPDRMFPGSQPFGDSARPSASILYVPARKGAEVVGVVSIQSYTPGAYDRQSLETLQALADHCGGALDRLRAQEDLRRSEAKFRTLYDSTSDAVMLSDMKGFFDCNKAALAMFGCGTREEFCAKHPADVSPRVQPDGTDSLTLAKQHMATAIEKGSYQFEWMHKRADTGETFPAEVLLCALELDGKRVLQGSVRDIAARKRSEASLRLQSVALEAAANAIVITDQNGTIQWVNPAFTRLTGYTPQEAVGQNPRLLKSGRHQQPFYQELWQTIASGHVWHGELINRRKDGCLYTEEMTITPVRGADGTIARYIAIKQDITERKRTEEALREIEVRLAHAMSLAQLVAWEYDVASGLFTFSDRFYAMHGTTAELEGGNQMSAEDFAREFVHPDDAHLVGEEVGKAVAAARPDYKTQIESRILRRDGELRHVIVTISVTKDAAGRTVKLRGANQDITERKRAQAELENLQKQLVDASREAGMAEIATNVLHNVGNVLNSVNISTGLIVQSVKKSRASSLARVVALLQEHAQDLGAFITHDARGKHVPEHLAQLAEHLRAEQESNVRELDLLRRNVEHIKEIVAMQQNYASFGGVKEMVNVVDLVEDSLRLNDGAFTRHEVEVIREFGEVPLLNVEKHKILQILVNLLRNAKYACQESGRADKRLTVRVANGEGRVKISVIDNGVGIPAENLMRIFNHGFTTRKDGHGFGLHSGALAAKEMGGALTVQSAGIGQGATFTLELPASQPADIRAAGNGQA
jgi:PAS domain S-box-containing protein